MPTTKDFYPMYKIWRSYRSRFAEASKEAVDADLLDETIAAQEVYTDEELERIASEGFNGIWIHAVLRHLVKADPFPEFGRNAERHLTILRDLIVRAGKYGLKIWLFMQPPRAVPATWTDFWEKHADIAGEEMTLKGFYKKTENGFVSDPPVLFRGLCTSTRPVKDWLVNASAALARELPELGGMIVISGSEFPSHCYTHSTRKEYGLKPWSRIIQCPRCREREPEKVAAEVLSLLAKGIHSVAPQMEVVAWNWSWGWRPDSYERVIENLPSEIILLADFERGQFRDIPGGKRHHHYDEYSLGYAGPSQRFLTCYDSVKKHGLRMMAKLQIGTTHELPSVVNLPMVENLFKKIHFLQKEKLAGFMGCWNFGNYPSANTAAVNFFLSLDPKIEKSEALELFASQYFDHCKADLMRLAWEQFTVAMEYFPFTIAFLYHGAHAYTLAYHQMYHPAPLTGKPAGRSWQPDERGDELENSYRLHHTEFTLDDIIERVGKLAATWRTGVLLMEEALQDSQGDHAKIELGNVKICAAVWRSVENTYKIYRLRQKWSKECETTFNEIVYDELGILYEVLPYVERDRRQGMHLEPQVEMFNPESIRHKIEVLEALEADFAQKKSSEKTTCKK